MHVKKTFLIKVLSFTILFATVISLGSQLRKDIQKFGNVLSASSPWIQTDWSGGQNSEVVSGMVSTYLSASEINTLTANSLSLAQTNGWSNDMLDWSKRKSITLNNTLAEQTNYQVRIPVSYDSDMQPDFDDIRFTNSAGTVLDFWLEHKVDNTSAIVWVEVDTLAGSGNTSIYMYYGNSIATSSSNGLETFILFDDFTADTLDPKWTVGGTNVYTLSNDRLNLGPGSSGWNQSLYATSLLQRGDLSFDMKYKWTSSNASYDAMMLGWKDNTANASYTSLIYAYYNSGTGTCVTNCPVNVYESGTNRSPVTGAWTVNQEYLVRVRMRNSGGAFYEQSTDFGNTWNTSYTSTFSTATNIRPGWALYSGNHEFDDVRVRKWMTTEPTANFNNEESKYQSEGILDSNILDTGVSMDWGLLNYISSGTGNVTVKVRTDNSNDMGGATAWGICNAITSGTDISANNCVDDGDRYIQYQVTLEPSGASTPVFEEISIAFVPSDQVPPDVNATNMAISGLANSGDWYANEPTITWTGGVDDLNGNGILGHCIAIDEAEPDASNGLNPAMTSGILTGKNDGVAQEYCPYIVVGEELEVSAVTGLDLIAGKQYYISIKAVDIAGNIYTGTDETWKDLITFKYDNEEPTAPFYISLPANFLSSKDVVVTWPVGVGGADDLHSGLAGLQYRIGDTGTWYGDLHTGTEDINDLLINDGSYVTDETYDYPLLEEGNNLIYFRAIDNLGNVTAPEDYVKGILKLNTVAPSPVRNLSVNPENGTENNYTFTWDVPGTYTGSSSGI
ncbi:MAG TPA: DUF2341 domain-containing protein, partial [Candidatus Dojkabacteria bacterium]|nr:DUF2341 domain-containing protein [Candidatus Dojkabacteria bacterium]